MAIALYFIYNITLISVIAFCGVIKPRLIAKNAFARSTFHQSKINPKSNSLQNQSIQNLKSKI